MANKSLMSCIAFSNQQEQKKNTDDSTSSSNSSDLTEISSLSSESLSAKDNKNKSNIKLYELKVLAAALGAIRLHNKSTNNHTFHPNQVREIQRENASLISRLHRQKTRTINLHRNEIKRRESSSAINRRHVQQEIQRQNMILLRKIVAARGSVPKKIK